MLLRNRSRAVTKPSLMADHSSSSQPSAPPNQNYARRTNIPSLFGSPKFRDFTNKCHLLYGAESLRSPTSILDTRGPLSPFGFLVGNNKRTLTNNLDSKQGIIGLAIVGALKDEEEEAVIDKNSCGEHNKGSHHHNHNNNVLFGTQLRNSGIYAAKDSSSSSSSSSSSRAADAAVKGVLSLSEMELCEEYTRVTSHGPNPRTTHIFNNCILEGYFSLPQKPPPSGNSFLSFCFTCKKKLDHTKDIFIYRGEKAFCSPECRHREMVLDGVESLQFDII